MPEPSALPRRRGHSDPCKRCLILSSLALAACVAPVERPFVSTTRPALASSVQIEDLRADDWKSTKVLQTSHGVVQHVGDDRFPDGGLSRYIADQLADVMAGKGAPKISVKTTDIRLSIPGARIDQTQLAVATATGGLIAAPMFLLLDSMSRNKSASAVLCVSVDGQDFLGNDARLFAFGAEGELRSSLAAAIAKLRGNIESGSPTTSPACQPGWEGGQPR